MQRSLFAQEGNIWPKRLIEFYGRVNFETLAIREN